MRCARIPPPCRIFISWNLQASKQASKQANEKQANKQASKQANKQASKQTSKQTNKQASKQTSKQASKQASKQVIWWQNFPEKKVISPLIFLWFLSILGAWEPVLEAWVTFWAQGSDFCDFWDLTAAKGYLHFGPKMTKKSFKNRSQTQQVFRSLFWSTLEPSWGRFGRILGAKMEPKLVQNRSQERSWRKFKNH